ncbi:hypothetical protein [Actinoplanes aureus]|uniref:Uncharacterized protein n=1 Tax=Actinoplanes aureus TaxID=2792083 RepID=A0A931CFH3_9ACTN|nr:hypothetical protein [Actinoplanes aureus]MBG0567649.1 hypothetical protein [Actinoplanes aureus]
MSREIVNGAYEYKASGTLADYPSNCSTFRVYLTYPNGTRRWSTSAWSCSKKSIETVWVRFPGETSTGAKAEIVAYNSSGTPILDLFSGVLY